MLSFSKSGGRLHQMDKYEFSDMQNKVFLKMSAALRRFAITQGVFAILLLFLGIVFAFRGDAAFTDGFGAISGSIGISIVGIISLFLSFRLFQPVDEIKSITTTEDQDISRLLNGISNLNRAHNLLRFILGLFLLTAAVVYWRILT
jgi:hypothetical protein